MSEHEGNQHAIALAMSQLDRIVGLYRNDFGECDIQAINRIKREAEKGRTLSKSVEKLIKFLDENFYVQVQEDEAVEQAIKLLSNRTDQAEMLLGHYRKENKRNEGLKKDNSKAMEQLKITRDYINNCLEAGVEIRKEDVVVELDRIIESGCG